MSKFLVITFSYSFGSRIFITKKKSEKQKQSSDACLGTYQAPMMVFLRKQIAVSEAYLQPSRTSTMELFTTQSNIHNGAIYNPAEHQQWSFFAITDV